MITDRENDTIYYLAQRQKKHEQEQEIQSWRQGQSIPCFYALLIIALELVKKIWQE